MKSFSLAAAGVIALECFNVRTGLDLQDVRVSHWK